MAGKLNGRQQLFVLEYLIDRNAEQAAIRAGYSAKYARGNAHKLVANSGIAAEIQRLNAKTAAKLEITRESVMQELAAVGFARATDFVHVETEPVQRLGVHPITGEELTSPGFYQTVRITDTDELPEEKAAALAGIKQGANGIEVKLHDKVRALELLGKAVGLFDGSAGAVAPENNLFEAIVGAVEGDVDTDEIPELEQEAAAGDDVVATPRTPKP